MVGILFAEGRCLKTIFESMTIRSNRSGEGNGRLASLASSRRIPSLDGIRALSIALVLYSHADGTRGFPKWLVPEEDFGRLGVRIFFVISGFLITTLLLDELSRGGSISLRGFYLRRSLRIFPACYFLLTVFGLLSGLNIIALQPFDLLTGFTYTANYHSNHSWYTGHLWSLSVEEQFYLIWPPILCYLGTKVATRVALSTILIAPLARICFQFLWPGLRPLNGMAFPTTADAIATGCVLAFAGRELSMNKRYLAFLHSRWFLIAPVLIFLLNHPLSTTLSMLVGQSLTNILVAVCIHRCVLIPQSATGRILNSAPLRMVGVLSYSLYLWQQPFLNRHSPAQVSSFPLNILLAATAAILSYVFIEKPFLRLKDRLELKWAHATNRVRATVTPVGA